MVTVDVRQDRRDHRSLWRSPVRTGKQRPTIARETELQNMRPLARAAEPAEPPKTKQSADEP